MILIVVIITVIIMIILKSKNMINYYQIMNDSILPSNHKLSIKMSLYHW